MTELNQGEGRDYRQLMKEALLELESLQSQLEALRRAQSEPIAVVGLACRFPAGANSPAQFWELLRDGVDAVREIPPARWQVDAFYDPDANAPGKVYSRHSALVDQDAVEGFDPAFFGIAPREAERMDPQQRMLLEVCWEALEDAAVPPDRAKGSRTGLFVGSCTDDYLQLFNNLAEPAAVDGYSSLGTARCITVGRVSYLLGLEGPAVQLDTACSSSLVAVHQACASLRSKECEMALAGGVNLQLSPVWTVGLSKLKALSPDGRCKTFDASANGFVRGEGCGVLVLKRLSDAEADGDRVLALIRGSAVNHDGRSSGLTVPNQLAQEKLLRQALDNAQVQPEEIDYIEAHGTGTSLGDPVEMGALATVFADRRRTLWVGSVKTNIGHLEAAAGIAGLAKLVLAMEHEQFPPHLHFKEPNPHIPWDELPAQVPVQRTAWPRGTRRRLAGVSSFGFSGTNAHVIVEEAPTSQSAPPSERPCHLLVFSARCPEALRDLAERYAAFLDGEGRNRFTDVCYTACVGRGHFDHRLAVVAATATKARQLLVAFLRGDETDDLYSSGSAAAARTRPNSPSIGQPPALASLDATDEDWEAALANLAKLYVSGHDVDWAGVAPAFAGRKVSLPTYPFQRKRYWLKPSGTIGSGRRVESEQPVHPLLGRRVYSAAAADVVLFETEISAHQPPYLSEHRAGDTVILPATAALELAFASSRLAESSQNVVLEDISFFRALTLPKDEVRVVQTVLTPEEAGYRLDLFSRTALDGEKPAPQWIRHASCRVLPASADLPGESVSLDAVRAECPDEFPCKEVYARIASQGLRYGKTFQSLRQAWRGHRQTLGYVEFPEDLEDSRKRYWFHPALLDACLHVIAGMEEIDENQMILPSRLERFEVFSRPGRGLWSHVRRSEKDSVKPETGLTFDIDLIDPEGTVVSRLHGLRMQRVQRDRLMAAVSSGSPGAAKSGKTGTDSRRPSAFVAQLRESPQGNRLGMLVDNLRNEIVTVLGWDSREQVGPRQKLFDLGMDSLTSVELQQRLEKMLGCPLPLTLAFDYPTVEALAVYIADQLELIVPEPDSGPSKREVDRERAERVAAMSDEEVQSLLADKLKDLL